MPFTATVKWGYEPYCIPLLLSNSSNRTLSFLAVASKSTYFEGVSGWMGVLESACRHGSQKD